MPTYDFHCQECGLKFEARLSLQEKAAGNVAKCPQCESANVKQAFRTVAFARKRLSNGGCCGPSCGC